VNAGYAYGFGALGFAALIVLVMAPVWVKFLRDVFTDTPPYFDAEAERRMKALVRGNEQELLYQYDPRRFSRPAVKGFAKRNTVCQFTPKGRVH
jgi:hypothetical protein